MCSSGELFFNPCCDNLSLFDPEESGGRFVCCRHPPWGWNWNKWHVLANSICLVVDASLLGEFVRLLNEFRSSTGKSVRQARGDQQWLGRYQQAPSSEIQLITPKFHHLMLPVICSEAASIVGGICKHIAHQIPLLLHWLASLSAIFQPRWNHRKVFNTASSLPLNWISIKLPTRLKCWSRVDSTICMGHRADARHQFIIVSLKRCTARQKSVNLWHLRPMKAC